MSGRRGPDVLIVGGGPAGSALAWLLAGEGWEVELIDRARFPRAKPCGECVSPGGVAALRRLGLLEDVLALDPAPLDGWTLVNRGGPAVHTRFAGSAGRGLGVPRADLDAALLGAARRRGVRVTEGVRAVAARPGGAGRRPRVDVAVGDAGERAEPQVGPSDTTTRAARILVGADGLRSVVARSLEAYRRGPRIRKVSLTCRVAGRRHDARGGTLVLGSAGTVGLAPVTAAADLWNATVVGAGPDDGRAIAADAAGWFRERLRSWAGAWEDGPRVVGGPWASGPFDWPTRRTVADGVLLVGDAAGYFDPLTGQGIYRALRSAELAAPVIDRALRDGRVSGRALRPYQRSLGRELRPGRGVQRLVEAVVSRPGARHAAFALLSRATGLATTLVHVTGDVTPARRLLDPRGWFERTQPDDLPGGQRACGR